ncbi:nitroreductase [Rhodobacteraceae bacterium 2CG4]|uniref:Putative NAD(P)H nitroreductase n=1 Tax=Halovulum marinum TaxID=2662447 RepID=A0A6L5YX67_9RHOB|nr:nitroreductase family protein [Halovulum marinum]MSU88264.1 nitroreductase [Halovulum marinum]
MPDSRPEVLDFLLTRRSRPARTLHGPGPDRAALTPILEAGLRVPDHGKLEPWELLVLERAALDRLAAAVTDAGPRAGQDAEQTAKQAAMFADAPLIVAVVSRPVDSPKIPRVEQRASAACVCLSVLNAALAAGWGANWLTGWTATEPGFLEHGLALAPPARIAGYVVIGTEGAAPPERPRPDPAAKIRWLDG